MRALRRVGGTPIEEAPLWALAILVALLALVFFPALIGVAEGFGVATAGRRGLFALAGAALAVALVAGLARQRPWKRSPNRHPLDGRPPFVRFSTWLWTAVLFPNILHGLLVLTRDEPVDYRASLGIGLLVSAVQGALGLADRRRRHRVSGKV
jgi:hypothetical protein